MKRLGSILILASAVLVTAIGLQSSVHAGWSSAVRGGENVVVAKGDTHRGSLYVAAETVKIEGTVEGDVYCAAGKVIISGEIDGSVVCAAETVVYSGTTSQSVRLVGSEVRMEGGAVGSDASIVASTARIDEKTTIAGDLNGAAQLLDFKGTVAQSMVYAGMITTLNGVVQGDVNVRSDVINLEEKAAISGNLHYSAAQELDDNKAVEGKLVYNSPETIKPADVLMTLLNIAMMIAFTGLVLAFIVPRFMERSSLIAGASLGKTTLVGSATLFITPLIVLVLFLTGLGAPLAIVLLLLYGAALLLSGAFFAYYLGAILLRSTQSILVRMVGGSVVLGALWLIPGVNIVAILATIVIGTGIVVRTVLNGYRKPSYEVVKSDRDADTSMPVDAEPTPKLKSPKPIADKPTKPKSKPRSKPKDTKKKK